MQRNRRSIKKIIQEPRAIQHNSNVHRREIINNPTKPVSIPPTHINNPRHVIPVQNSSSNKITYNSIPRKFEGETIYLIGGGPSLRDFNFNLLKGSKTIAINKAILFYPNADVLFWTDTRFYNWHKNEVDNYKGLKFTLRPSSQYTEDINLLKKGKPHGLELDDQTLAHGNNSGYAAINLAFHLGARRIILLGFDMGNHMENNKLITHFHDGYPSKAAPDHVYKDKFSPGFSELKSELNDFSNLKGLGITVLNASPYSKLNVFPKITIEQALSFR